MTKYSKAQKIFSRGFCLLLFVFWSFSNGETNSFVQPQDFNDEKIREIIKKAGGCKENQGANLVVASHLTSVTVENTGLSHIVERRIIKILTPAGIKDGSIFRYDYDPATQYLKIRWAKIYKKDGRIISIDTSKVRDLPQPLSGIYWPMRMKLLEVWGLEPDDAVAYEIYRKGFQIAYLFQSQGNSAGKNSENGENDEKYIPPMKGHFYDVFLFEETIPVKEKRYEINIPYNKPFHWEIFNGEVSSGHRFGGKLDYYWWSKENLPPVPNEKRQPDRSDFVTKLVLATVKDWKEKSVWFFKTNEPSFIPDEAIKKKVTEIISGKKGDDEKVKALVRWVSHNIRYSGITMGKGEGYTLHPGTMTFNDRCGVCKDIAGMLVTMMRAAGYEAYPAMTMAGARVENIPADQFNHCVVAWKKKGGRFELLDPTWLPFDMATWSYAEGEQHYLIGTGEGEELSKTAPYDPDDNQFIITGKSYIDEAGNLTGKIKIDGKGFSDTRMRRMVAYQSKPEGKAFYEKLFASISPFIKIENMKMGDVKNLDKNFFVSADYKVSKYANIGDSRIRFPIPLAHFILRDEKWSPYFMLAPWKERKNPAMFWFPQKVTAQETVNLPPDFEITMEPEKKQFKGDFVDYEFAFTGGTSSISYRGSWKIKGRIATREHFQELDNLVTALSDICDIEVEFEKSIKSTKTKGKGK